ncbi:hypothetical protein B0H16DRAFT_1729560 [Mycena metata]|uniref:Uncharacterized protein n=1 Tax=Mycena metata TaxID=1033252 RepID=A0AAD7N0R4_9AGAR|nr:hypothetical protein B0H16DRAFT_1729560 [Mycena metata]
MHGVRKIKHRTRTRGTCTRDTAGLPKPVSYTTAVAGPPPTEPTVGRDFEMRRCILAVKALLPQFHPIDIEMLVDSKLTVGQLSRMPKNRMPACEFTFIVALHKQFVSALTKWLASKLLRECVDMLSTDFGGVVPGDLAVKMIATDVSVYELVDYTAADVAEWGLVVEEPVWVLMCTAISSWIEARATAANADANETPLA